MEKITRIEYSHMPIVAWPRRDDIWVDGRSAGSVSAVAVDDRLQVWRVTGPRWRSSISPAGLTMPVVGDLPGFERYQGVLPILRLGLISKRARNSRDCAGRWSPRN